MMQPSGSARSSVELGRAGRTSAVGDVKTLWHAGKALHANGARKSVEEIRHDQRSKGTFYEFVHLRSY